MAGSVNKCILIGNLGSDPDVKYFDNGGAVAKFSIATTDSYTNKSGEKVENTEWHRIELWEGLAKVAEKYLKKGAQVYVEGKIRTDNWTDKDGVERSGVTIRANSLTMLGGNPKAPENGLTNGPPATSYGPPADASKFVAAGNDDDLPF